MRLLDRYLLRELLVPLGYCLGGFLVFWISFDLFNELEQFQSARLKGREVVEYYAARTPELMDTVLPVALLLALLYALTNHARHHELVAIRAAGVSLWRLSAPYLGVGLLLSLALFASNEFLAPLGAERAENILRRHTDQTTAVERQWMSKLNFSNDREHRLWSVGEYNLETSAMRNPVVEWDLPDGTRKKLFAESGLRTNGVWTFHGVVLFIYEPPQLDLPVRITTNELACAEFSETPELIRSEVKISGMSLARAAKKIRFTLGEILDYERLHPQLRGERSGMLRTQFHARLAAPWKCLVVVLIALPFGAQSGRRNVFVGVASSILICFSYFVLAQLAMNFGTGGHLPAWLAAWLPNALFGGGGIWFARRVR